MPLAQNTFRATLTVSAALVLAFLITGFASRDYRRERAALGQMHFHQAQSLISQGHLDDALEEYRKALLFSPDRTEYRLSLATALISAGRLDEAQSHVEQLLQEDPTNGELNLLLARVAVKRHHLATAVEYYQRAVYEYWPASELSQRRQARWELANLLNQAGDRAEFIAELMQLYTNSPSSEVSSKIRIGSLLLANGATSEASRIFHDLVKEAPQNSEVHRDLGDAYFSSGEYVLARHEYQRALHLDPKDKLSTEKLAFTNDVIDLDPMLPNILSGERLRRSQNLLGRVLRRLEACVSGANPGAAGSQLAAKAPLSAPAIDAKGSASAKGAGGKRSENRAAPVDPLTQRLQSAEQLLKPGSAHDEDAVLTMQDAAQQLWRDKAMFCKGSLPEDRALDTVLGSVSHE